MKFTAKVLVVMTTLLVPYVSVSADTVGTKAATPGEQSKSRGPVGIPSFVVNDSKGNAVTGVQLSQKENWLLLYMTPHCARCDSFLRTINPKETAGKRKKIIVIVGKIDSKDLRAFAAQYRGWAAASWYADPDQRAFSQLRLTGVPVTLGMRGDRIEWTLSGSQTLSKFPKSALSTWLR